MLFTKVYFELGRFVYELVAMNGLNEICLWNILWFVSGWL